MVIIGSISDDFTTSSPVVYRLIGPNVVSVNYLGPLASDSESEVKGRTTAVVVTR